MTNLTWHEAAAEMKEIGVVVGLMGHCVVDGEGEVEEELARPRRIVPSS